MNVYYALIKNLKQLKIEFEQYKFNNIKQLSSLRAIDKHIVIYGDAIKIIKKLSVKFTVAFIDPPYSSTIGNKLIASDELYNLADDGSIIIFETSNNNYIADERWKIEDKKKYGETYIYIISVVKDN